MEKTANKHSWYPFGVLNYFQTKCIQVFREQSNIDCAQGTIKLVFTTSPSIAIKQVCLALGMCVDFHCTKNATICLSLCARSNSPFMYIDHVFRKFEQNIYRTPLNLVHQSDFVFGKFWKSPFPYLAKYDEIFICKSKKQKNIYIRPSQYGNLVGVLFV